jgi:hypothetical protein
MSQPTNRAIYAPVIIKLLQGPVYADETHWRDLLAWQSGIKEYFERIGIELVINETDGFARIMQPEPAEDEAAPLPRLMRKQALSYEASLLCVLIRQMLEEFDTRSDGTKLFVTQREIKERIELFFREQTNKSKLWRELSRPIETLVKVGILKITREDAANKDNNQYEVKRIVKALVNNDKLEDLKNKLTAHVNTFQQ